MKKSLYILPLVTLTSCVSDEYLGAPTVEEGAICLGSTTAVMHRSGVGGAEAAERLDGLFVVFGTKTGGSAGRQTVFDHYNVHYDADRLLASATNTAGWEYVGLPFNACNPNYTAPDAAPGETRLQTVKYWDHSASQYDFVAFSPGTAQQVASPGDIAPGKICVSRVDADNLTTAAFTLTGDIDDISATYLAPRITVRPGATPIEGRQTTPGEPITFAFTPMGTRLRFGLYETIPGYSVTDVTFHAAASTALNPETATTPILYTASQPLAAGRGTMTVSFPVTDPALPTFNEAHTTFTADPGAPADRRDIAFGQMTMTSAERSESNLQPYLGRSLSGASLTDYTTLPGTTLGDALCLKMDFTLVALDGYGETIRITGARATVPADYTLWQPGYAYTYIFKLSNLVSGDDGELLVPLRLDAVRTAGWEGTESEERELEGLD